MQKLDLRSTTVLGVRHKGKIAMGGDGQVTFGEMVMKQGARKVRKLHAKSGIILAGFAGTAADAHALSERFEAKIEEFNGNLLRAAVELAKEWKTDRFLRRLEALLAVMDKERSLIISGDGEVIEPDDGIVAIGSGGAYAMAAARAYVDASDYDAKTIVEKSLSIAASICVFTNDNIVVEEL